MSFKLSLVPPTMSLCLKEVEFPSVDRRMFLIGCGVGGTENNRRFELLTFNNPTFLMA